MKPMRPEMIPVLPFELYLKMGIPEESLEQIYAKYEKWIQWNEKSFFTTLTGYDKADLLAKLALLLCNPVNADCTLRIESLAQAVLCQPKSGNGNISPHKLDLLLNKNVYFKDLTLIAKEDPFDNPFTTEVAFLGGGYLVLAGLIENGDWIVNSLLRSLFLVPKKILKQRLLDDARDSILCLLCLSDRILKKCQLKRYQEPESTNSVCIPSKAILVQCSEQFRFTKSDIESITNYSVDKLAPFIDSDICFSWSEYIANEFYGSVCRKPIVKIGEEYVFATPSLTLNAIRHFIIQLCIDEECLDDLAKNYAISGWKQINDQMNILRINHFEGLLYGTSSDECIRHNYYSLDDRIGLHVIFLSDTFKNIKTPRFNDLWDITVLFENNFPELQKHLYSRLKSISSFPDIMLTICIIQGSGRMAGLAFKCKLPNHFKNFSAADFRTINILEGSDPLWIYKFIRTLEVFSKDTQDNNIFSSAIAEYAAYRDSNYSMILSDDKIDNIRFMPGSAGKIRSLSCKKYDYHFSHHYKGVFKPVLRLEEEIPLYSEFPINKNRTEILFEGYNLPLWIVGEKYKDKEHEKLRFMYAQLCRMIGFWMWQLTPSLKSYLWGDQCFLIKIIFTSHKISDWEGRGVNDFEKSKWSDCLQITNTKQGLCLLISPDIWGHFHCPDNSGEREFLSILLDEVFKCQGMRERNGKYFVNKHAPLGFKRILSAFDSGFDIAMNPEWIPSSRIVPLADPYWIYREAGRNIEKLGYQRNSSFSGKKASDLLKDSVTWLFNRLKNQISDLSNKDLLEYLIAYLEACSHEQAMSKFHLPTQIACFYTEKEMIKSRCEKHAALLSTNVYLRFLIEVVATHPPKGEKKITLSRYDELLATIKCLISFARTSDWIDMIEPYYSKKITVSLLPNGRIGRSRSHEYIFEEFNEAEVMSDISEAYRKYSDHWKEESRKEVSKEEQENNKLVVEYKRFTGVSLLHVRDVLDACMLFCFNKETSVGCMSSNEFYEYILAEKALNKAQVNSVIDVVSLKPRDDYLNASPEFKDYDLWPWRFNRRHSMLYRPLIIRDKSNSFEIVWGLRTISKSLDYYFSQIYNGRFRGKIHDVKANPSFNDEKGKNFERVVYERIESDKPSWRLESSVKRILINGQKMNVPWGDIDIMVFVPETKRILLIECKDLSRALDIYKLKWELEKLIGEKNSIVNKQKDRFEWAYKNLNSILEWASIDNKKSWSIHPVIITSKELLAGFVCNAEISVVSLSRFLKQIKG